MMKKRHYFNLPEPQRNRTGTEVYSIWSCAVLFMFVSKNGIDDWKDTLADTKVCIIMLKLSVLVLNLKIAEFLLEVMSWEPDETPSSSASYPDSSRWHMTPMSPLAGQWFHASCIRVLVYIVIQ